MKKLEEMSDRELDQEFKEHENALDRLYQLGTDGRESFAYEKHYVRKRAICREFERRICEGKYDEKETS